MHFEIHTSHNILSYKMLRFCILLSGFALLTTLGQNILEEPTPRLKLIGVYDGHSYFYDNTNRTWSASKSYCASLGMKLAEIYNLENLKVLQNYHTSDTEFKTNLRYWLAGRDARTPSQFVWDGSGNQMATDLTFGGYSGPYTMLAYYNKVLYSYNYTTQFGVICQS